jgi:hypothetical protein
MTEEIIIKRKRSGGDAARKAGWPRVGRGGVGLDETSEVIVGEPQTVSNSSGPLSGLEASLAAVLDSSMNTTSTCPRGQHPTIPTSQEAAELRDDRTHVFLAS